MTIRGLAFLGLLLLAGCASHPLRTAEMRPAHAESAPFTINGRISASQQGERHSAGLHWVHTAQSDEILLLTPLGQTAARIYRDDKSATLDNGSKHYQDTNAEALMQQVLGWHLPLVGLRLWILGLPADYAPAQIEHDGAGRIAVLHQDGWEVRYLRYTDTRADGSNIPGTDSLPARLQLKRDDLQVLLLIDEWEWNPQ